MSKPYARKNFHTCPACGWESKTQVPLAFRTDKEDAEKIKLLAKEKHISVSTLIREVLSNYLENEFGI